MSNHNQKPIEISLDRLSLLSEEDQKAALELLNHLNISQFFQPRIGVQMEKNKLTRSEGCPCKQPKIEVKTSNTSENANLMTATEGFSKAKMHNVRPGYEKLGCILATALEQAQNGKGNARHQIGDTPFVKQPICELGRLYGTGYNFGQAAKKAHETNQLGSKEAKVAELLGSIVYLAAAVILIQEESD